jgi:Flp pilus assembly protein TadG
MLMTSFLSRILNRKGQSIVEISLITPLLLVALYVPADFGIAFLTAHLTQNAVREAARLGAAKDPFDTAASTAIKSDALSRLPVGLSSKSVTVTYWSEPAGCARFVQVVGGGTYNYFLYQLVNLFGFDVNDTVPISRTARMRHASQPSTYDTLCTTATVTSP